MNTTVQCTKKYFDANFIKHGEFRTEIRAYDQYLVSKDVFNQLCPKEYQDDKIHQDDTLALKGSTTRLLIFNKETKEGLTLIYV